jgi:hypothetical protein
MKSVMERLAAIDRQLERLRVGPTGTGTVPGGDVPATRNLIAGAGLSGGGTLEADRTFAVGAGDGITVFTDTVALTTPGSLAIGTGNSSAGNHTHEIAHSSDVSGGVTAILSSNAGTLTTDVLNSEIRVRTPLIDTELGDLYLAPAEDLMLEPVSNAVKAQPGVMLQSYNYFSQITGWRITNDGQGDFRYLYADELHAKSFITDLEQALAGGQIISKSVAVLGVDFIAPGTSPSSVAYRAHSTTTSTGPGVIGDKPTGTVLSDLMLAYLVHITANTVSIVPDGWTLLGTVSDATNTTSKVYYKLAGSDEPSTYVWTLSGAAEYTLTITSYSGVNPLDPINVWDSSSQGTNTLINSSSVTTTVGDCKLVFFAGLIETGAGAITATPSAGLTERADYQGGDDSWSYYGEASQAAAGASDIYWADWTGAHQGTVWIIGLGPVPAGVNALIVKDLPSASNMAVFQALDIVRLRQFSRSGGSLTIANCWGVVTDYVDGDGTNGIEEGMQQWTFTRSTAPNAGLMAAGTVVEADSIVLDYGTSGMGYYEVNAIDGLYGANSPYAQIVSWDVHPATGQVVRVRMGNLAGIFSEGYEYGLYAGDGGIADNNQFLRISDIEVSLHNIPLELWNGANQTVNISYNGTDVWVGPSAADKRLIWNGTTLTVKGSVVITSASSGYASFTDKPTSLNEIEAGTGTKLGTIETGATVGATWNVNMTPPARFGDAPAAAGLYLTPTNMGYWNGAAWKTWIDSSGNFYFGSATGASIRWNGTVLGGYDASNVVQWYGSSTDGRLYAGAGNAMLDSKGLRFLMIDDAANGYNELKWSATATATPEFRILAIREPDNDVVGTISLTPQTAGKTGTLYIASYNQNLTPGAITMLGVVGITTTNITTANITTANITTAYTADIRASGTILFRDLAASAYQAVNMGVTYTTKLGVNATPGTYAFEVNGEGRITGALRSDTAFSLAAVSTPAASATYFVLFVDSADGKLKYRITSGLGSTVRTITYT